MEPRIAPLNASAHATPARHYLRNRAHPAASRGSSRGPSALPPGLRFLAAGHALTLRARRLSVLRISHGRVWLTLTNAGPCSRVLAGDHFLNPGESLTLLPGQELVMEPFGTADGAPAQFTWGESGAEAVAARRASALRRLAGAALAPFESLLAIILVAAYAGKQRAAGIFNAESGAAETPCRLP